MVKPMGILISSFDYSPVAEDEFHDWYDTEHIPERARIPGFLDCRRWLGVGLPKVSVTTYELASVDVLRSEGYLAVGYENNSPWTRRVGWRCIKRRDRLTQKVTADEIIVRAPFEIAPSPHPEAEIVVRGGAEVVGVPHIPHTSID